MRTTITALSLAGFLFVGASAFGQEQAAPETPETPADALSLGEPVEPRAGQIYVADNFGDWELRCIRAPEGEEDRCNMYQLLADETGQPISEFNLFRLPEGGQAVAGANVVVPLETLLTEGLTMTVGTNEPRGYPFSFCNAAGCIARIGLTQEEVDAFKRGATATLRMVPAADPAAEYVLTMSLSGFTAGFDVLTPVP